MFGLSMPERVFDKVRHIFPDDAEQISLPAPIGKGVRIRCFPKDEDFVCLAKFGSQWGVFETVVGASQPYLPLVFDEANRHMALAIRMMELWVQRWAWDITGEVFPGPIMAVLEEYGTNENGGTEVMTVMLALTKTLEKSDSEEVKQFARLAIENLQDPPTSEEDVLARLNGI